jgi:hypothetical protein
MQKSKAVEPFQLPHRSSTSQKSPQSRGRTASHVTLHTISTSHSTLGCAGLRPSERRGHGHRTPPPSSTRHDEPTKHCLSLHASRRVGRHHTLLSTFSPRWHHCTPGRQLLSVADEHNTARDKTAPAPPPPRVRSYPRNSFEPHAHRTNAPPLSVALTYIVCRAYGNAIECHSAWSMLAPT